MALTNMSVFTKKKKKLLKNHDGHTTDLLLYIMLILNDSITGTHQSYKADDTGTH